MRLYSIALKNQIRLGAELAGRLIDLNAADAGRLSLKLNGEAMQDRTDEDRCFARPRLLEWSTVGITPERGDVVAGGIGRLVNRFVPDEYRFPQKHSPRKPNLTDDFVEKP
ncbi:MAG: hypothetical protein HZA93_17510 [Verrucomicrobia bacterium]|nr:hypothetical protein [Verrucomicrobiota bacterium]